VRISTERNFLSKFEFLGEVPRRLWNRNKQTEKGSARSFSWHSRARESMP
jgi:hypothetical protein